MMATVRIDPTVLVQGLLDRPLSEGRIRKYKDQKPIKVETKVDAQHNLSTLTTTYLAQSRAEDRVAVLTFIVNDDFPEELIQKWLVDMAEWTSHSA